MKEWIEKNPAIIIVCMVVFGIFMFILAGMQLNIMIGLAETDSVSLFKFIGLNAWGCLFTVVPVVYLYEIIEAKNLEYRLLRRGGRAPLRARGGGDHWQTDIDDDDDLDGDGDGNDALRRLGAIR